MGMTNSACPTTSTMSPTHTAEHRSSSNSCTMTGVAFTKKLLLLLFLLLLTLLLLLLLLLTLLLLLLLLLLLDM